MKLYTCTEFTGVWPVGVSAVVVAECASAAQHLLNTQLVARGLAGDAKITEENAVDLSTPRAIILDDGNY